MVLRKMASSSRKAKEKPDLLSIFQAIQGLMKKYEPPFHARADYEARYELWSEKEVVVAGRKRKDVFFAALIIQSTYVGFYYMPVYVDTRLEELFAPVLLRLLKGKSCFHVKVLSSELLQAIDKALAEGFEAYKKREWV